MIRRAASCLVFLMACSRPSSDAVPAPSASAASRSDQDAAVAGPVVAAVTTWVGAYKSTPGTIYVPAEKEWAQTKWRGDESAEGLGDGNLILSIDAKSGRVEGTAEGAIGPALLAGRAGDGSVTARVDRKDPRDNGLTGTLVGKISGDKLEGIMHLALSDARVIRETSFTLGRK